MAKEICISSTPHETRLAILEDDQLAEIYYERENEYTLAGSIYNGRVTRVLPGMQSAFVDVGLERDAFLYVTDFLELEDPEEAEELEKAAASGGNQAPREIRHTSGPEEPAQATRNGGRSGQKPDRKQEPKHDRQPRNQGLAIESMPEAEAASPAVPESSDESGAQGDSGDGGAKRWRGRRRRRGGRPGDRGPESTEGQARDSGARRKRAVRRVRLRAGQPRRVRLRLPHLHHTLRLPATRRPPSFCPASRFQSTVEPQQGIRRRLRQPHRLGPRLLSSRRR